MGGCRARFAVLLPCIGLPSTRHELRQPDLPPRQVPRFIHLNGRERQPLSWNIRAPAVRCAPFSASRDRRRAGFLGREDPVPAPQPDMPTWQERIYAVLARNAVRAPGRRANPKPVTPPACPNHTPCRLVQGHPTYTKTTPTWRRPLIALLCATPAHVPERGFKPNRGVERRLQGRRTGVASALGPEPGKRVPCRAGSPLVVRSGIGRDPRRIRVGGCRPRRKLRANFRVAQHAGGQGGVKVEEVTGCAAVKHEAGVGDGFERLRLGGHARLVQAPPGAERDMQRQFAQDRGTALGRGPQVGQALRLEAGKRAGARELDQEEAVLCQAAPEGWSGKRAVAEAAYEPIGP